MSSCKEDKVFIKTNIVCFTNKKIILDGRKLFAKGDLLLEKKALRFKLRSCKIQKIINIIITS
jgi:hypothetical protein